MKNVFMERHTALLLLPAAALSALLFSCGGIEKSEDVTAEIVAAQMEGRKDARNVVNLNSSDTAVWKQEIEKSRRRATEYADSGKMECALAYDSIFVSTVKTVRPEMSKYIENADFDKKPEQSDREGRN